MGIKTTSVLRLKEEGRFEQVEVRKYRKTNVLSDFVPHAMLETYSR